MEPTVFNFIPSECPACGRNQKYCMTPKFDAQLRRVVWTCDCGYVIVTRMSEERFMKDSAK